MARHSKRIELLLLMDKAGLIDVPAKANGFALKTIKKIGAGDKASLVAAISECEYGRSALLLRPSVGAVTVAEMCWFAVYGEFQDGTANK